MVRRASCPRRRAPSRTCSRPASTSSSAASTPGSTRTRRPAHFANPRNDFWRLLHAAGFTPAARRPVRAARGAPVRDRDHERRVPDDAWLVGPPKERLRGQRRAARAARARSPTAGDSASSARRPTAARSADGRSTASRTRGSARRSSSSCRRPRPRTPPCRGTSGSGGSARSARSSGEAPYRHPGARPRPGRADRARPLRLPRMCPSGRRPAAGWRRARTTPRRSRGSSARSSGWSSSSLSEGASGCGRTSSRWANGTARRSATTSSGPERSRSVPALSPEELRDEGVGDGPLVDARGAGGRDGCLVRAAPPPDAAPRAASRRARGARRRLERRGERLGRLGRCEAADDGRLRAVRRGVTLRAMTEPPTGAVTFLFTDIEGSTQARQAAPRALRRRARRPSEPAPRRVRGARRVRGRHAGRLVLRRVRERARRASSRGRGPARAPVARLARGSRDQGPHGPAHGPGRGRQRPLHGPRRASRGADRGGRARRADPRLAGDADAARGRGGGPRRSSCGTSASSASRISTDRSGSTRRPPTGLPETFPPVRGWRGAPPRGGRVAPPFWRRPSGARCSRSALGARRRARGGRRRPRTARAAASSDPAEPRRRDRPADATTIVAEIPVGIQPGPIAAGAGSLWVGNLQDRTLTKIDPATALGDRRRSRSGTERRRASRSGSARSGWRTALRGDVSRVDPQFGQVTDVTSAGGAAFGSPYGSVAVGARARCGPCSATRRSRGSTPPGRLLGRGLAGSQPAASSVAGDSVWVTNSGDATVQRFSVRSFTEGPVRIFNVGERPTGIAYAEDAIWVASSGDDVVRRIDPGSAATLPIPVGDGPSAVASRLGVGLGGEHGCGNGLPDRPSDERRSWRRSTIGKRAGRDRRRGRLRLGHRPGAVTPGYSRQTAVRSSAGRRTMQPTRSRDERRLVEHVDDGDRRGVAGEPDVERRVGAAGARLPGAAGQPVASAGRRRSTRSARSSSLRRTVGRRAG